MRGRFLGLEIKAPRGEPSELQLYHLENIRKAGGYGVLLYPKDFDNFKEFVADTAKGNSWYLDNIEFQDQWKEKLRKRG
nr:MAG TPA: hydrolase [Caudoviricetes sp.]